MSIQSDVELLTVMSVEGYAKLHNISIDEAREMAIITRGYAYD